VNPFDCDEPIISAENNTSLSCLNESSNQEYENINFKSHIGDFSTLGRHLVSHDCQHLHVELHVKFALEALLRQNLKSLPHIVYDCVVDLQVIAGTHLGHKL
jgi:hypothetical protein